VTVATIELARAEDVDGVLALLEENQLATAGLALHIATTMVARDGGRVVGSAALETYADGMLLRSVSVTPTRQHQGLGRELMTAALQLASNLHGSAVYLLTTTADQYFPKFGFERIARTDVPASVQTSVEFTSACPSTATVMLKRI
jgi:amino-acid N-acetyltransferase